MHTQATGLQFELQNRAFGASSYAVVSYICIIYILVVILDYGKVTEWLRCVTQA